VWSQYLELNVNIIQNKQIQQNETNAFFIFWSERIFRTRSAK